MYTKIILKSILMLIIISPIISKIPIRHKRYIAFPEGASLSIAICMTSQAIIRPSEFITEGLNWGISYDLPNSSAILEDYKTPGGFVRRRRSRRDLYQKMELIMDSMGYNGKQCVLRALCEAAAMFISNHEEIGLLEKSIMTVFGFPIQEILDHEPEDHRLYQEAHLHGKKSQECSIKYSKCTFSLVDMALGMYSYYS
ncbi:uncharacterized protein [Atheta coriaria]|uniref:uncharacterized protein n=1 Tax=Dalotia coriaria TaxID=877792 RepID=UPI0031F359B4